jgi:hypothetical protein
MKVKTRINTIARKDLNTILNGILDIETIKSVIASNDAKETRLLQKNTEIMKMVARRILVLPSSRWINESAG